MADRAYHDLPAHLRLREPMAEDRDAEALARAMMAPPSATAPTKRNALRSPREWTATDKALQAAMAGATLGDWLQTRTFLHEGRRERNALLGPRPSDPRLDLGVAGALLGHSLVAHALPSGPLRTAWQLAGLDVEMDALRHNHRRGVRISLGRAF